RCRCSPDCSVNAGRFLLQILSCRRCIGTDGRGSPSAARAARCLSGCKKEPVPFSRLCLYYHLKGEKRLWKKLSSKLPKQ
ncbi:hypothetical protein, partial [Bacillus velezensis]|uniref:hypothetical protein n=1 Tax=Bacillus velezensis TaxID=492670 RepID=UPI00197C351D